MKYCRLVGEKVAEIFEFNPFEWIPNEAFLANCMECPDNVQQGFLFKNNAFVDPNNQLPADLREQAYRTLLYKDDGTALILWRGIAITVDQANKIYGDYVAEGSPIALEIQLLIAAAKTYIRELYPDSQEA